MSMEGKPSAGVPKIPDAYVPGFMEESSWDKKTARMRELEDLIKADTELSNIKVDPSKGITAGIARKMTLDAVARLKEYKEEYYDLMGAKKVQ